MPLMSGYIRAKGRGSTFFFTVAIADRRQSLLVDHVNLLRRAFVAMNRDRPVTCRAMVVLPDHLHAVWTLPEGDGDFSTRWGVLKSGFTRLLREEVGWNPTLRLLRWAGLIAVELHCYCDFCDARFDLHSPING